MLNPFAHAEQHLGRAGWLLMLELGGVAAAGLASHSFSFATDYLFVGAWLFNLFPAWFLSQAARAQGKSALLYGLISAVAPAGAIAAWILLYTQDYGRALENHAENSRRQLFQGEIEGNEAILAHVESLGGDYVWESEIFVVFMLDVAAADSDIVPLSDLRGVQQIALNASRLSYAAIESVARIPGLESLVLGHLRFGDDQIEALRCIGPEIEFATDED